MSNTNLESEKFIRWSLKQLEDPEYYNNMKMECMLGLRKFFSQDKERIMELLRMKLERGGREHGDPNGYTQEVIDEELEEEYTDLVGWRMISKWTYKTQKGR